MSAFERKVSVTGLGYIGLPVSVAFGKVARTIAFDINRQRVRELSDGWDRTGEVNSSDLRSANIHFTCEAKDLAQADFHIVAVPTPIDEAHQPDMSMVRNASMTIGQVLKPGDIVVYESTVYPGATEEDCVPILERSSGLKCGVDFKVGYSPERINPGDREHTFVNIKKVVSGQDEESLNIVAAVYGSVVKAGVFRAPNIRTAEASKVIENIQRDLNIALMNELALIFDKMGIETQAVLEAAATKWNFLKFSPGLVGGHCIGVDPYYLTNKAERLGYIPQVILSGRRVNNEMGRFVAQKTLKEMIKAGFSVRGSLVTVLGLTFKENCSDIRNTRTVELIHELEDYGVRIQVHDPFANAGEALDEHGIRLCPFDDLQPAQAMVVAVAHQQFRDLNVDRIRQLTLPPHLLMDIKSIFPPSVLRDGGIQAWRL